MIEQPRRKSLLLVDDEPVNLRVLNSTLKDDYRLIFAKSGEEALRLAVQEKPDLVLLDIMMPGLTGMDVCRRLKQDEVLRPIPVIFVTALSDEQNEEEGLRVGAVDYIIKPISPAIVKARVRTHLSLVQAEELRRTQLEVVQCLGRAAEFKDNETGLHVMRMSYYSRTLARAWGMSEEACDELLHAAPMHDLGKIGIPDRVLLKPGKLTDEEYAEMKQHPDIGVQILGDNDSRLITLARSVALTHHEKWDGSGYPRGLKGEEIPIEGRIVAVADVFDALTSERPYKKAWSIDDAIALMREQKGRHFQPELIELLEANLDEILEIRDRFKE